MSAAPEAPHTQPAIMSGGITASFADTDAIEVGRLVYYRKMSRSNSHAGMRGRTESRGASSQSEGSWRRGVVTEVVSGSPAQDAGLQAGDVLIGIDGNTMKDGYEAMNRIAGTEPGTKLTLNVRRNTQELDLDVTIGTRPPAEGS